MKVRTFVNRSVALGAVMLAASVSHAEPDRTLYENLPPLVLPEVDSSTLAKGSTFRMVAGGIDVLATGVTDGIANDSMTYSWNLGTRYFASLEQKDIGAKLCEEFFCEKIAC